MERQDEDGEEAGGARDRASRRAVASGALIATGLLFLVAAATEGVNFWLVVAIPVAVAAAAIAVGERVQARRVKKLVAAGRRLAIVEALLANIPDPVVMVDRRAIVREVNGAARELLPGLRLGHPLSFALRAPQVLDGVEEALRTGERVRIEYAERVPTERVFEVLIGPLDLETDRPGGDAVEVGPLPREQSLVLYFRDLTSARRLETMRVDFVANVSHELRTPLSSLLGFVETLQGPARNDAAARERFLEIMRVQAQRMSRLIDDLLSLSRIELRAHVAPQTPLDVGAVTRQMLDTLAPLARERGVEIVFEAPPQPALIAGERDELLRVVENLVENAVKYGDGGGRVEVGVARRPSEAGEIVRLAVRDYGPGIAPEHVPRLTERFYRVDVAASREKGGTGLGLAIVKHIVARHRGRLTIESTPGEGALFAADFPALAAEAARTPAVSAE
ncbi:ATP-binding protein [Salinarimonas rosea]|uniref:ATP-binding protein n=1 Tax=Salinarimonas rosea TaxID=552063 RepID=UPI0003FC7F1D